MKKINFDKGAVNIFFWIFLCIGIFARVWRFGEVPADINVDEAFAGYEAYSLLHYGMDSHGYRFPIYLTTWGSGMSALNSYLMLPFLAIFGAQTFVIRIPQLIVGCLTLWVVFLIVKRLLNEYAALCSLFLLAISPWHIMMCRWGMDANLEPGFILFGLYFFIRGLEDNRYLYLSGVMYGLSLYCYATIWPFLPLMLLLQIGYAFWYKKLRISKQLILFGVILFIFALPLFLFLLVNFGFLDEICLPFLSIPRLLHMRSGEFSLDLESLYAQLKNLWHIIKLQNDWHPHNVIAQFGIFYQCSFPFFIFGCFSFLKEFMKCVLKKEYCPLMMILIQLGGALLLGVSIWSNINRVNILFIPMIIITACGIYYFVSLVARGISRILTGGESLKMVRNVLLVIPLCLYLYLFVRFEEYYFTTYKTEIEYSFCKGIEEAVDCAMQYEGTICVSPGIEHPRILFYSQMPVTEYLETVEYVNYPSAFLRTASFGRFEFEFDATKPKQENVYILSRAVDLQIYEELGFQLETFDWFTVAHK